MRIKRKVIAVTMTGLAVLLSAALLGGTLTVATSAAKSASTAKAKAKKTKCKAGQHKQGKVCVETKVHVQQIHKTTVTTITEVVTVTNTVEKTEPGPEEKAAKKLLSEEEALVHPGLWPTESTEKGGTKAIENASEIPPAPKWTNEQLDAWPGGNWIVAGGGNSLDRYSDLNEINLSTVKNLKSNWMIQLDGSGNGEEAPSGEYNGVLYYATGVGDVFAVSVKSGKILWIHLGELIASSYTVCCGKDSRGVALWNGLVYVGTINSAVEALEMKTGKLVWYAEVGYETEGFAVNAAPMVYDGVVYMGATGAEHNVRGFMEALNAETGALVWKKYNIPGPGEYGHETWPTNTSCVFCNYTWATGGAAVWNAPAVDPETGDIIYVASNASSQFGADYYGQERDGANLWTDSFLARHPLTGEIAWGFQTVHHDIWDYDMSASLAMIETEIGGKKVTDVSQTVKSGIGYDLEATTGAPQTGGPGLGIEEKPVPVSTIQQSFPTQPIPKPNWFYRNLPTGTPCPESTPVASCPTGEYGISGTKSIIEGPHMPHGSENALREFEMFQSTNGASGYHAERGGYPCHTTNICPEGQDVFALWGNASEPNLVPQPAGGSGDRQGAPGYNPKNHIMDTCGLDGPSEMNQTATGAGAGGTGGGPNTAEEYGFIHAYNMETGETVWEQEIPHQCFSGFLEAGELTFWVNATGQFFAYNAKTGATEWEWGEESNLDQGCKLGAEKKVGVNPVNPTAAEPVGPNKNNEIVWCHHEQTKAESELTPKPTSPTGVRWSEINSENFKFGNPGLGAGGAAPPMAFEFEGKEYIVVVAAGGGLSGFSEGDGGPYMWEFSLTGSNAQGPIKEGEAPIPAEELCPTFKQLREEHKTCGGY